MGGVGGEADDAGNAASEVMTGDGTIPKAH